MEHVWYPEIIRENALEHHRFFIHPSSVKLIHHNSPLVPTAAVTGRSDSGLCPHPVLSSWSRPWSFTSLRECLARSCRVRNWGTSAGEMLGRSWRWRWRTRSMYGQYPVSFSGRGGALDMWEVLVSGMTIFVRTPWKSSGGAKRWYCGGLTGFDLQHFAVIHPFTTDVVSWICISRMPFSAEFFLTSAASPHFVLYRF